jgi:hypothetical protein
VETIFHGHGVGIHGDIDRTKDDAKDEQDQRQLPLCRGGDDQRQPEREERGGASHDPHVAPAPEQEAGHWHGQDGAERHAEQGEPQLGIIQGERILYGRDPGDPTPVHKTEEEEQEHGRKRRAARGAAPARALFTGAQDTTDGNLHPGLQAAPLVRRTTVRTVA